MPHSTRAPPFPTNHIRTAPSSTSRTRRSVFVTPHRIHVSDESKYPAWNHPHVAHRAGKTRIHRPRPIGRPARARGPPLGWWHARWRRSGDKKAFPRKASTPSHLDAPLKVRSRRPVLPPSPPPVPKGESRVPPGFSPVLCSRFRIVLSFLFVAIGPPCVLLYIDLLCSSVR